MEDGKEFLLNNLVRLGDMMGDGLHNEPGGAWIKREYEKTLKHLGIVKPKTTESIDKFMLERCDKVKCTCGGTLKQVRKGTFIAKCMVCGEKYRLGQRKK